MKDEQPVTPTDQTSTDSQETPTAPSLELTDSQASYLKGLNIEDPTDAESIVKIIDSAIKQKASVSRMKQGSLKLNQSIRRTGHLLNLNHLNKVSQTMISLI